MGTPEHTSGAPGTAVLGIDSGGSGLRVAVARAERPDEPAVWSSATPVAVGAQGIDAHGLLAQVLPAVQDLARRVGAERIGAACVGAAGMASLGDGLRAVLPAALADALGVGRLALAADGVTAYAGALGQRPGAVVAAGTGLIALGTDLVSGWRRADGWGHLLGDCGGGAWIGRAGLEAALRAHDGRAGGSPALLARAEAVFGPIGELPGLLYPRTDRPAVLASFAPQVGGCAGTDPVADRILRTAARHIAQAAQAVCPPAERTTAGDGPDATGAAVALTGGLTGMGEPLLGPLRAQLAALLPHATAVAPAGDPLAGALGIAAALADGTLRLPADPALLTVRQLGAGHNPA
ncbi:N-acetylglucosamine kinase [Streptomyces palmae]|uniref:ATPase n=1 Tax=Streptomyces palmae TaxID=1701085 RepID=A0A4Z0HFN4_9ACTN|nr:BadF/BadG/BcrA/BcrD ATPase family protein [Streptomyces palmae]TGB18266.1 ATPase [Streptomyces palmae]